MSFSGFETGRPLFRGPKLEHVEYEVLELASALHSEPEFEEGGVCEVLSVPTEVLQSGQAFPLGLVI